jgi:hypothetical protein
LPGGGCISVVLQYIFNNQAEIFMRKIYNQKFDYSNILKTGLIMFFLSVFFVFASGQTVIHCWDFNNGAGSTGGNKWPSPINSDARVTGNGAIEHNITDTEDFTGNNQFTCGDGLAGASFCPRPGTNLANNGSSFILKFSTIGFEDINLWFRGQRTTTGFNDNEVHYSIDGGANWILKGTLNLPSSFASRNFDFSSDVGVSNNEDFQIRITLLNGTGSNGNNRYDNIRLQGTPISLPITMGQFTVTPRDKAHFVEWTTLDELNNDFMSIEHSADGRNFYEIHRTKGAGNSYEEQYYSYLFEYPTPGINYYRIKQVDYDGQFSYSEIRSIRHDDAGRFHISPSNTEGMITVSTDMESYSLQVFNTAGQELRKLTGLSQDQTIYLDELKAGMYIIRATNGSEVHTERIVKL